MKPSQFAGPRLCPLKLLLAVLALALLSMATQAAPYTPAHDAQVLERLPFRAGDATARELSALRAAVAQAPTDPQPAAALAHRYFDLAIAKGDPRYVGYADALVSRFSASMPLDLLVLRGMVRQYRHDFQAALDDFAAALAQDADLAGAHAWRGAIYLVQADYARATQECVALQRLQRAVLHGGCAGLTLAYTGHLDAAYKTLQQALAAASDAGHRLWLNTRLGEVAAWQGLPDVAQQHYRQALALDIDDGYLLAAWSDFLLDQGRPAQVVQLLTKWEASDGLLLRLAEAETLLKLPAVAAHVQALDDRFAAARLRGDTTHQAEEARYQLRLRQNARQALALAAANYRVQKEPRDARILLETAWAAQDRSAARAALDWIQSSGFEGTELRRLARQFDAPLAASPSPEAAK